METLLSVMLAACVTLFFVWRYVKGTARDQTASHPATAVAPVDGKPRPVINASLCIGCASCVDVCPEEGTLAMAGGKAILAHPDRCVGHAKCVDVCPTQGIVLSFGGVLQTMRVPMIKENFETNVPGVYIIGELGGVGLIKNGINEGKLVIDHLRQRLGANTRGGIDRYDVIIVGSGPAGLSASLSAHQYGLCYLTFEQGEIAATIRHYPRHKLVFAEPIEMPLYGNLYMADSSKESLVDTWERIIRDTGVRIQTNTRVESVQKLGDCLRVETKRGEYLAGAVVLATGRRGSPRRMGVPGEDLGKVAYRLIEAETYGGQDILVVGGGDSAVECAVALAKGGRNRVTLSYRGDALSRPKQRNQMQLATAEMEKRIRILLRSQVLEVRPQSVVLQQEGKKFELPNSYVFVLIGGQSPEAFLGGIGIEIVEKATSVSA